MKKTLMALAAAILGLGLALSAVVAPASAHTATVTGQVSCQSDDTYTVTWKGDTSNVPNNLDATVQVTSPINVSLPSIKANKKFEWVQTGIAGSATSASVTFQLVWTDGYTLNPTASVQMDGTCGDTPESETITFCHATSSETNPYTRNTTSTAAFFNAGHIDHEGDIFPAGSIIKQGVTHTWAAQGDQSLLAYTDCTKPVTPPVDVCPNLADIQESVPEGYMLDGENCVLIPPTKPDDRAEYTEWVDGLFECGDTEVEQTRERVDVTWALVENEWVEVRSEPVTEAQVRQLESDEITICPTDPPVEPELPETPALADTGQDNVLPMGLGALALLSLGVSLIATRYARRTV